METLHVAALAALVIGAYWYGQRQGRDALARAEAERSRLVDELLRLHGVAPISQESVERAVEEMERRARTDDELRELFATEVGGEDD